MPLETKVLFIALLVGLAHIAAGAAAIVSPGALLATPLACFDYLIRWFHVPYWYGGLALCGAGAMAVLTASTGLAHKAIRTIFLLPQQVLLFLQLISISYALALGRYPDGYAPVGGAWFILSDQIWAWILAISHSVWLSVFIYRGVSGGKST